MFTQRVVFPLRAVAILILSGGCAFSQTTITTFAGTDWAFPASARTGADAPLGKPESVAVDRSNNLYIADSVNQMVLKVQPNGALTVLAGNGVPGFSGEGGPAAAASLHTPHGVTVDAAGNVYIADTLNHRIRKVNTDGSIVTVAGNGTKGYSGDNGPATSASLASPFHIAVDAANNLYIADWGNSVIRRVSPQGIITTFAGNGKREFSGDGGRATAAGLNAPEGVAVDANGNVFIADTLNFRIRMVNAAGTITTAAGNGRADGSDGPALSASAGVPKQLAFDRAGNLFFADPATSKVRRLDTASMLTTVAGAVGLAFPTSVAVDSTGNVFVAELQSRRIRKVAGGIISTFVGNGQYLAFPDGSATKDAYFSDVESLALDGNGNLYAADADANRVYRITPDKKVFVFAGTGRFGFSGDGGQAAQADLNTPVAVAVDSKNNVYILDSGNQRVRQVNPSGVISTVAGNGNATFAGDGGPAIRASLQYPRGIAFDSYDVMYIADTQNDRIRKIDSSGTITTVAGSGQRGYSGDNGPATAAAFFEPDSITVDSQGNLYIGDISNHRIRKVANGIITTVAGNGQGGFSGDGPATAKQLYRPEDVKVDAAGSIFIADTYNNLVRRVGADGNMVTIAGTGSPAFFGDGGAAIDSGLYWPSALVFDNAGNLYVSDRFNGRIRVLLAARPSVTLSSTSLDLSASATGVAVSGQVALSSSLPNLPFSATASTDSGGDWLSVTPATGNTPWNLRITADPASLNPGNYRGTVTVSTPTATTPSQTIIVMLAASPAAPPDLVPGSRSLSFSFSQGDAGSSTRLALTNQGGGRINLTARFVPASGGNWLTLDPGSATAAPGNAATISVSASPGVLNPGTYSGAIEIASASRTLSVPVTMTVTRAQRSILLSQVGLTFTGVSRGGLPLPQTAGILNAGQGAMNWTATATTLSGGSNWLSISPTSGTVTRPFLDVSFMEVNANPATLDAGDYYGKIEVRAAGADNSPQTIQVVLNVLRPGSNPGPDVRPTGLVFTGLADSSPSSQTLMISNLTSSPIAFGSSRTYVGGGSWFAHVPADGTVQPTAPAKITVQPDFTGLAPGVRRGYLNVGFADGNSRTVNILTVVAPPGSAGDSRTTGNSQREAGGCPNQVVPQFTSMSNGFAAPASQPVTVAVKVVDDCGNALNSGAVVAQFSNGDADLRLVNVGGGQWSGTWQPRNTSKPQVQILVDAWVSTGNQTIKGSTPIISGTLVAGATVPLVTPGSVLNSASFTPQAPTAPGSLISIFGARLADRTGVATTSPWSTELAGTEVVMGGRSLPLLYASDGQVNAQVPFDLPPNTIHQVLVRRGAALSVPETITVAPGQPAIFTKDQSGKGQGAIVRVDNALAEPATPAAPGNTVVIYCTGLGAVNPPVPEGTVPPQTTLSRTTNPVTATIGGQPARVDFAGLAPCCAGLYQVNAVIAPNAERGDAVDVTVSVAGQTSPPVTIAVR